MKKIHTHTVIIMVGTSLSWTPSKQTTKKRRRRRRKLMQIPSEAPPRFLRLRSLAFSEKSSLGNERREMPGLIFCGTLAHFSPFHFQLGRVLSQTWHTSSISIRTGFFLWRTQIPKARAGLLSATVFPKFLFVCYGIGDGGSMPFRFSIKPSWTQCRQFALFPCAVDFIELFTRVILSHPLWRT